MEHDKPASLTEIRNLHRRALSLGESGRWAAAVPLLRRLVGLEPDNPAMHNNLGIALWQSGNLQAAEEILRKALDLEAANPAIWLHYGEVLCARGNNWKAGAAALERGMPAVAAEYLSVFLPKLAAAYLRAGRLTASERVWHRITKREPGNAAAWNSLGMTQCRAGEAETAVRTLARLRKIPSCPAHYHSNLLLTLLYRPSVSPQYVYSEHRKWALKYCPAISDAAPVVQVPGTRQSRRKRIRIGYVSADFRDHSVRYFIEPLLRHHDRSRFDVHIFSNNPHKDEVTAALAGREPSWHDIYTLDDEAAAKRIRRLNIDVLIDLSGHTSRNRLGVFARKPARVQATYLGYPATTGLSTINFRLTDSFADPPGRTEQWHAERLLRLDPCFLTYAPPPEAPAPKRQRRHHVAFGCFATLVKISPEMIRLWTRILDGVPDSVLVLKSRVFDDPESAESALRRIARGGIPLERLKTLGYEASRADHLARYSEVDIALDTYPWCGTTTTCEALWMGVPTVTLCGAAHASRVSGSILAQMNLPQWIANTEDKYVEIAISLARLNSFRTTSQRRGLRARMTSSPLLDHARHAALVEAAFSGMLDR